MRVKRRENEIITKSFVSLVALSTFAVTIADRYEILKGNRVRGVKKCMIRKVAKSNYEKYTHEDSFILSLYFNNGRAQNKESKEHC